MKMKIRLSRSSPSLLLAQSSRCLPKPPVRSPARPSTPLTQEFLEAAPMALQRLTRGHLAAEKLPSRTASESEATEGNFRGPTSSPPAPLSARRPSVTSSSNTPAKKTESSSSSPTTRPTTPSRTLPSSVPTTEPPPLPCSSPIGQYPAAPTRPPVTRSGSSSMTAKRPSLILPIVPRSGPPTTPTISTAPATSPQSGTTMAPSRRSRPCSSPT